MTKAKNYSTIFSLIKYLTGVTVGVSAEIICERLVVDHIFDHLQLWTTWKQREREHRKASFSDTKAPKSLVNQGKNRYRFLWEHDVAGSNPVCYSAAALSEKINRLFHFFTIKDCKRLNT